jgi:tRNA(Ile)-lysidine synthase
MRLKEFFIDQKVPRHERARVPLVIAPDGRIVWVVGHRIAHDARLPGCGESVLHLRAVPLQDGTRR